MVKLRPDCLICLVIPQQNRRHRCGRCRSGRLALGELALSRLNFTPNGGRTAEQPERVNVLILKFFTSSQ